MARRKQGTFGRANRQSGGMSGLRLELIGAESLITAFTSLGADAVYKLSEPSVAAAKLILGRAKAKVSVDRGDLKRALKVYKPGKSGKKAYRIIAKVGFGKGAMHGVPLELGHMLYVHGKFAGYVQPRPFLRPAADESKEGVVAIMSNAMSEIIKEAGQV